MHVAWQVQFSCGQLEQRIQSQLAKMPQERVIERRALLDARVSTCTDTELPCPFPFCALTRHGAEVERAKHRAKIRVTAGTLPHRIP